MQYFKKNSFLNIFEQELVRSCVISQLRKEGPREPLHDANSVFVVDEKVDFLQNISNIVVFGTDNPMQYFEKSNFSNIFWQEFVSSCNFPIKKWTTVGAAARTHFILWIGWKMFPIFLFLEQRIQWNCLRKAIFEKNLSRNS